MNATTVNPSGTAPDTATARYLEPGWFTRNIFNRLVRRLTRLGISVLGSRELRVQGRTSGEWRSVPVNLLTIPAHGGTAHEGSAHYLVAPRGVTQWVRNLRAAGGGQLIVGRRCDEFVAEELADEAKPEILRPYLRRWKAEVGVFFDGISLDATDEELLAIAPGYPVFRVTILDRR
jgi:hypothetical protein